MSDCGKRQEVMSCEEALVMGTPGKNSSELTKIWFIDWELGSYDPVVFGHGLLQASGRLFPGWSVPRPIGRQKLDWPKELPSEQSVRSAPEVVGSWGLLVGSSGRSACRG
ncbi:hypothetical protein GALMADRAFT_228487 [Galerina marginata CBS 339.88]|uniref:Uncharacterized protein n=1 Tax=Galerina marginata (strain CBS 339.88) TaxID=685588 RepID=A0A067SPC1_GALM3|nr:hypothetical protein GALMADRAFT_228487 [Galerina marginata CBS 339.88]